MKLSNYFCMTVLVIPASVFAGIGGDVKLKNSSSYILNKVDSQSKFVSIWNPPTEVKSGETVNLYLERSMNPLGASAGALGTVTYRTTCQNGQPDEFTISIRVLSFGNMCDCNLNCKFPQIGLVDVKYVNENNSHCLGIAGNNGLVWRWNGDTGNKVARIVIQPKESED